MWRGWVQEVWENGRVWVTVPQRAGDEPIGPLTSAVSGLQRGDEVLVASTGGTATELVVVSKFGGSSVVDWDTITGKPSAFPPSPHRHEWGDIDDVPSTFPAAPHTHSAAQISDSTTVGRSVLTAADAAAARSAIGAGTSNLTLGTTSSTAKAGNYQPTWTQVTSKPSTFPPSAHSHVWADISDRPSTMPPSAHTHSWSEVTDKPSTFPAAAHTHPSADISDATSVGRSVLQASTAAAARTAIGAGTSNLTLGSTSSTAKAGNYQPTWAEVTGKPTTFAPSAHTHDAADVASGVLSAERLPDASSTSKGALSAAHWALLNSATTSAVTDTLAVRESGARLQVGTPTLAYHAANKSYVDGVAGFGPWTSISLANGWSNLGGSYGIAQYRLAPWGIQFRGVIVPGTLTANIAALPTEAWPSTSKLLQVQAWTNQSAPYRLLFGSDGRLSMNGLSGTVSWVTLDGLMCDLG